MLVALLVEYWRAFIVAPLNRYDAWAIWALKGHALYALGWADPASSPGPPIASRTSTIRCCCRRWRRSTFGRWARSTRALLHLQFLLLLVAALAALGALLRDRVPPLLLWLSLFAIALAPAVFDQLLTAYADLPLALVFAVGVAAAGRWVVTDERWALALAALCFAGALLTKNEGTLFVVAVFRRLSWSPRTPLASAARSRRRRRRAAAAVEDLRPRPRPSRHQLQPADTLRLPPASAAGSGVGPIAFRTLGGQMLDPAQWGLLLPLFAVLLVVALVLTGLRALPLFALVWTLSPGSA